MHPKNGIGRRRAPLLTEVSNTVFGREQLFSPALDNKLAQIRFDQRRINLLYASIVGSALFIFYFFAGGYSTLLHWFYRINNLISVGITLTLTVVANSASLETCLRFEQIYEYGVVIASVHWSIYNTMTFGRSTRLLGIEYEDLDSSQEMFEESYGVCVVYLIVLALPLLRLLTLKKLFAVLLLTPMAWVLQVALLGTELSAVDAFRLGMIFISVSLIGFLAARRFELDFINKYVGLEKERSEMWNILQHASVPIALVNSSRHLHKPGSRRSHRGSGSIPADLCVELWNDALQEATSQKVVAGTPLAAVQCLRQDGNSMLSDAIRDALSEAARRTSKMIYPLVASTGTVWLQLDISPVHMEGSGMSAMIIGSDVTEFVGRYASLLRPQDEHQQPGQISLPPAHSRPCQLTASLDPDDLVLEDCSPHFNFFFMQCMDGRSLRECLAGSDDERRVQEAVDAVKRGHSSREVSIMVMKNHRTARHSRRSSRRRHPLQQSMCPLQQVQVQISRVEGDTASPRSTSPRDQGKAPRARFAVKMWARTGHGPSGVASDPGVAGALGVGDRLARGSGPLVYGREHSAPVTESGPPPPQQQQQQRQRPGPQAAASSSSGSENEEGQESETRGGNLVRPEAVVYRLVELCRHLSGQSFLEGRQVLMKATEGLFLKEKSLERRFGSPCSDWQCPLCQAFNDEEDDLCEVCMLSFRESESVVPPA